MAHVIDAVISLKDQFSGTLKNVSQGLSDFQKKSKYIANDMKKVGKATESIGKNLMTRVTAPIVATGTVAAKSAMDFKESIANIDTLLDDHSHLKGYEQQVLSISKSTGMSLDTVAKGMYTAVSSIGDGGKETQAIFKTMANAAKAGGAEVDDSVALISAAMKGYGSINDKTANKISDLAFQTAKLGVTTFPEMAKSMQPLFPLAKNLNFSYEELFGTMATLTGVTGNTSEVSTQLKAVFSNMMKPTKEMSALMKKYGFSNAQAMVKSKGLAGTIDILKKETGGQADKMSKLFSSTEAVTAIMALTGANYDELIRKTKEMQKASGSTDKALRIVSSTTKDKFNTAINNLKVSLTELGVVLLPIVTKIADSITKVANKFGNLSEKQRENIVKFALMAAAIGPVIFGIGKITTGISKAINSINKFSNGIKKAGGLLKFLTSPGHMVVIVLMAIAVTALLVYKNWDKLSAVFKKAGKSISEFTGISKKDIQKFGAFIGNFLKITGGKLKKAFGEAGSLILPPLKKLFNTLKAIFQSLMPILMPILKFIGGVFVVGICFAFSKMVTVISAVIKTIGAIIGGLITILDGIINFIVGVFTGNWRQAWNGIKSIFSGVLKILEGLWNGLVDLLTAPVEAIVNILDAAFKEKVAWIKDAWNGLKEFLKNPIQGTVNLVKKGANWVGDKISGKNALGTSYWGGGYSVVGEHGPEVVELPSGSKVHDTRNSKGLGGGINIAKLADTLVVREDADIDKIADALVRKLKKTSFNMA